MVDFNKLSNKISSVSLGIYIVDLHIALASKARLAYVLASLSPANNGRPIIIDSFLSRQVTAPRVPFDFLVFGGS